MNYEDDLISKNISMISEKKNSMKWNHFTKNWKLRKLLFLRYKLSALFAANSQQTQHVYCNTPECTPTSNQSTTFESRDEQRTNETAANSQAAICLCI
jgi:hypothetical protein